MQINMQIQEKANHLAFAAVLFFCKAGVAQSNFNKCWNLYKMSRTAVMLCHDVQRGLSGVGEMNNLGHRLG